MKDSLWTQRVQDITVTPTLQAGLPCIRVSVGPYKLEYTKHTYFLKLIQGGAHAFVGAGLSEGSGGLNGVLAGPLPVVASELPASCQAGMLGRPRFKMALGVDGDSGRRVTRSAFKDFNSCCNSDRACV